MVKNNFAGSWLTPDGDFGSFPEPALAQSFKNGAGMRMVYVTPGAFNMGGGSYESRADSMPVHKVSITKPYAIADEPVRFSLFEEFSKQVYARLPDKTQYRGFVLGVSWYEAVAFCRWLSQKEGVQYRLPTEAEWEYAARNSTALGVDRMCDAHIREWCFDWYEAYCDREQTDPAGPDSGHMKAVRGGYLDNPARYNEHPLDLWLRAAMPPSYAHYPEDTLNSFGRHIIGFRVVCAPLPKTSGEDPTNLVCTGVHQNAKAYLTVAPDANAPYFRKRHLFPVPPDNASSEEILAAGLNPSFRHHHHSPGFTVAPNGDLIYSAYSSYHEYDAEVGLAGARLRKGCDEWEMPDMFINPVGVNDHAPLMFTDEDGSIYHFWGWQQLDNSFPFQYAVSTDSGATWSEVRFPFFTNKPELFDRQPINTCIRAKDGTFYLPTDAAKQSKSILWRSRDNMKTWEAPLGRTAGRHSTIVELNDGSILAMGGKNTDIDGYMPKAISKNGGDTWEVSKTPFPALNSGQRPCVVRLQSGKLFMCGDYQALKVYTQPEGVRVKGCYGAWSTDEGETWTIKKLWGTQPRKHASPSKYADHILGYSVCRQAPDGMIHIVISNTHPLLHLEFNEAWLLSHDETAFPPDEELMVSTATRLVEPARAYEDYYENGQLKCRWSGAPADDGRFLLDGEEVCYFPDGKVMSEGFFRLGKRIGLYTMYDRAGRKTWQWNYLEDGTAAYTVFYKGSDQPRTVSHFENRMAEGTARTYARSGALVREAVFHKGAMIHDCKVK